MRKFLLTLFIFCSVICFGQNIASYDTIYNMKYYAACYNENIQTSSFVIYKLYKGGGDESRVGLSFKPYDNRPHFEYAKTGYDRGHLLPAEDYAYDYDKLKSTFYYINCVPQTARLNRGIWKTYETKVREISQSDSLLIICGGCDYEEGSLIPKNCFKIVYNLKNHRCLYTLLFTNHEPYTVISENKLKKKITFKKAYQLYKDNVK